jgi:hypothetical protein
MEATMFRKKMLVGARAHPVRGLAIILMLGVICALWLGHVPSQGQEKSGPAQPMAGMSPQVQESVSRAMDVGFGPSLEMRENVDFLLTPALLVQEAISTDIIPTYPCE